MNARNTLARGLVISKITYLISVWGGATRNYRRKAQTLLNSAARWGFRKTQKNKNHQSDGSFRLDDYPRND